MEEVTIVGSPLRPTPVALGLDARGLAVVGLSGMAAYALLHTPVPGVLSYGGAAFILALAAALAWWRWQEEPLLEWALAAAGLLWRRRQGGTTLLAVSGDEDGLEPAAPWARWLEPTGGERPAPGDHGGPHDENEPDDDAGDEPGAEETQDEAPDPESGEDLGQDEAVVIPLAMRLDPGTSPDDAAVTEPPAPAPRFFAGAMRRIAFFSLNGGSGRTTIATEVAALLAQQGPGHQKLRVALIDLDLRSSTTAVRLGIPYPTIWDYLSGEKSDIRDCLVTHKSGLEAAIGAPKPVTAAVDLGRLDTLVTQLESEGFHFVIFDIAADLGEVNNWVLNCCHDIFVLLTASATGVQDAYRTTEVLRRMGLRHKIAYVANKAGQKFSFAATMSDLNGKLITSIAFDPAFEEAENQHRLAVPALGETGGNGLRALAGHLYPALEAGVPRRARGYWWRRAG